MKDFRHLNGVSTLKLDADLCVGCGACTIVCPQDVLTLDGAKAQVADPDGCMECGACAMNCPVAAISVHPGVGCASYIIQSWIRGKDKAACSTGTCC